VLVGKPQVAVEDAKLPLEGSRCGRRPVEAALAHGAGQPLTEKAVQPLEVDVVQGLGELWQKLGMDAQCHLDAGVFGRPQKECLPGLGADGRNDEAEDAGFKSALQGFPAVDVEARDVEVAVGVNHPTEARSRAPTA
jgi:hypothetical protein